MPGKFEFNSDPELAEFLYERSLNGWQDAEKGSSDQGGWYCLFVFEDTDIKVSESDNRGILARLGAAYVCHEDENGFWMCSEFDSVEDARKDFDSAPEWDNELSEPHDIYGNVYTDADVFVTDDNIVPTCDICGNPQMIDDYWNGDTGNHISCEKESGRPHLRIVQ